MHRLFTLALITALASGGPSPALSADPSPPGNERGTDPAPDTAEQEQDAVPPPDVEIVVRASFRDTVARDVPASVVVLDADTVTDVGVQHFENLSELAPNLNFSGEGNRAKYWQIRGIGERAQYDGAPNPSVGFVIDDVDFSGIGGIATMWDVDQVEVLRGPQGTRYGANALAGMVYVRSAPPPLRFEGNAEVTIGGDDAQAAGLAVGGPIDADGRVAYRISAQKHSSHGFRTNRYLDRTDTNGRDETTVRGKLRFEPTDRWTLDLAGFYVDADDGYDAFTLDNGFDTQSDRPGKDAQRTVAGSLRVTGSAHPAFTLVGITSAADSDTTFGFDADWGNDPFWAPYTYDFVSNTARRRKTVSQEIRLVSTPDGSWGAGRIAWIVGAYGARLDETNDTADAGTYLDPALPDDPFVLDSRIRREYRADTAAVFGETSIALGSRTDLDIGLRVEHRDTAYRDDVGNAFDPAETMVGGQITLAREVGDTVNVYGRLARGYKGGGFNLDLPAEADDDLRRFDAEYLWNLEAGVKARRADGRLAGDLIAFWSIRRDQQVETSVQLDPNNPTTFVFFTDNAGRGRNAGIEGSVAWQATRSVAVQASLGWLETEIVEFGSNTSLEGRAQAHAPRFTYAASGTWRGGPGLFARLDVAGRSSFYFDDSHDQQSEPYALVHARFGLERRAWAAYVWGRNLFDEAYATRGFYFGNEPPDFPDRLYVKRGDPRQFGLTVRFRL